MFEEYGKGKTRSQTTPQDAIQTSDESLPSLPFELPQFCTIGMERGLVCYCAGVECVFEMELYRYKHKQERREVPYESFV